MKGTRKKPGFSSRDFQALYEVSTSIRSIKPLDAMLHSVLDTVKKVFNAEGASLALHDGDQGEFYFIRTAEEQLRGDHVGMDKMRFPDHLGVAGCALRENEPIIITDVSKDDRVFEGLNVEGDLVVRSMICMPLRTPERLVGVLYALNKLDGEFTADEAKLLEVLSLPIGIALENARLYGKLEKRAGTLELENSRLRSELRDRFDFREIVGSSPSICQVLNLLKRVIDVPTTVLLMGETGTGKGLLARVIHYNGLLKNKPFVSENCGALTETLLESELFGYVKGAFTGAVEDKKGIFEIADGGTIFLDEIATMPLTMQVKLLRVLEDGQFRPVGGTHYRKVNIRLIASTNVDLEEMVKNGTFRDDLFYRINVFPIKLPPLRDRKEDIPLLAMHFLKLVGKKFKRRAVRWTPEAMEMLSAYNWPGNVRELRNEVERALTLAENEQEIGEHFLSDKIRAIPGETVFTGGDKETLQAVTARVERRMIWDALQKNEGNRSKTARILGLTRQGLLKKIARYNIEL